MPAVDRLCELMAAAGISYRQIILFGSCAKGLARPHSDIDLCVVVDEPEDRLKPMQRDLNFLAARNQLLLDVIVTNEQELISNRVSPLLHEIRTYGKLIRRARSKPHARKRGGRGQAQARR
jgi:predicted nucleotidyltransferase